jgi:hypothetical protein
LPAGWKWAERGGGLSLYPPDGQSLVTLTGNLGWLPFEKFVSLSVTHQPPKYVPVASPREFDGENSIGRCFEFAMPHPKGTGTALAYCLQTPKLMLNISVLTQSAITAELRETMDSVVGSVHMIE